MIGFRADIQREIIVEQVNLTIDGNLGTWFKCSIGANATVTISNIAEGVTYTIQVVNTAGTAITVLVPSSAGNYLPDAGGSNEVPGNARIEISLKRVGDDYNWLISSPQYLSGVGA